MLAIQMNPMLAAGLGIGGTMAAVGGLRNAPHAYHATRELGRGPIAAGAETAGDILKGIGVTGGGAGAAGLVFDGMNRIKARHADTMMDAEGQPGGFYGNK